MLVDDELLRSGGDESHRAGEHAHDGAEQLTRAPLTAGMFGDFTAADRFHDAISSAHTQHVDALRSHHVTLMDVGDRSLHAAYGFAETENTNAKALGNVLDRPSTEP